MLLLLLLLVSSLPIFDTCFPTSPSTTPSPPLCSALCAPSLLVVPAPIVDTPSTVGACAVRSLECVVPPVGGTTATISYNGGAGSVAGLGMVTFTVTCNGAGTAWTYMGTSISSVLCTIT